jgi:CheY-like chemotaxis protein
MKTPRKKSSRTESTAGERIAIIEEIADNIYSVKFILESLGHNVCSFSAGESLYSSVAEFSPDLIIVDMMIPNRGGFHVIERIQEGALKKIPILAITADAMEGREDDVYQAGGQDVLPKPYTVADLQKKLKKWLA